MSQIDARVGFTVVLNYLYGYSSPDRLGRYLLQVELRELAYYVRANPESLAAVDLRSGSVPLS